MRLAVLDDYQNVALDCGPWAQLAGRVDITVFRHPMTVAEASVLLQPFEALVLMRERLPFPAALFEALPRLRLVVMTGNNARALDLEAATRQGVVVSHTGSAGSEPTAELAWGLILALARQIPREDRALRAGRWQETLGIGLGGLNLGLLGLGRIGRRMAAIGQAFGMAVMAWSQNLEGAAAEALGVEAVSKERLFREADVLSLHLVLSARTRGVVGATDLALMKRSAFLINTARGPLVDEAALVAALQEGRIAGAGLDVFDCEPLPPGHALLALDNVVLTPHLGYVVGAAYRRFYADAVEDVLAFLQGAPIRLLNPGVQARF